MERSERVIRILIADDLPMFRVALGSLLEQKPGLRVVGEAGRSHNLLEQARRLQPDVLLMDWISPCLQALEILRRLADVSPCTRTIIVTAEIDDHQVIEAVKAGAQGVILKQATETLLFKSINAVVSGEYWINHRSIAYLISLVRKDRNGANEAPQSNGFHLTERELQILSVIVQGCTNKEIAVQLSISEQTVKHHLTSIYGKVGTSNRLELAMRAMQHRSHIAV